MKSLFFAFIFTGSLTFAANSYKGLCIEAETGNTQESKIQIDGSNFPFSIQFGNDGSEMHIATVDKPTCEKNDINGETCFVLQSPFQSLTIDFTILSYTTGYIGTSAIYIQMPMIFKFESNGILNTHQNQMTYIGEAVSKSNEWDCKYSLN